MSQFRLRNSNSASCLQSQFIATQHYLGWSTSRRHLRKKHCTVVKKPLRRFFFLAKPCDFFFERVSFGQYPLLRNILHFPYEYRKLLFFTWYLRTRCHILHKEQKDVKACRSSPDLLNLLLKDKAMIIVARTFNGPTQGRGHLGLQGNHLLPREVTSPPPRAQVWFTYKSNDRVIT